MFGLENEEKRDELSFIIKHFITIVGALFALIFGTAHLAKIDQEQVLKSKLIGDTNINALSHGPYKTTSDTKDFCFVSGSYQVKNIGKYPFIVDEVEIELWEFPYINDEKLDENKVLSYSLSERLQSDAENPAKKIGQTVTITVGEQFGIGNQLQRSFGFIVPISNSQTEAMKKGTASRYVVLANASARIDERAPWYSSITKFIAGDPGVGFLPNDLQHMTGTFNICDKYPN